LKKIILMLLLVGLDIIGFSPSIAAIIPNTNALVFHDSITPIFATENHQFGRFLSLKSNLVVFGNWIEPSSSNNILATIFRLNGHSLEPEGSLPAPAITNLAVQDLATDGRRIVFAASENNASALYIFNRSADQWLLEKTLHPASPLWSVSIFDGVIAVGAPGKVLVYDQVNNAWEESIITAPTNSFGGAFGVDVSLDGDTLLVGSPGDSRGHPGGAFVYVRGAQGWQLQAELPGEQFIFTPVGRSVALEGDLALVTAYPDRFNSGFVYVYERSAGAWTRLGYLTGDGGGDFFGESVAIDGRNLVVGAPSARAGGGVVFLFRYNGDSFDQFRLFREEFGSGPPGSAGSFLGYDVAIHQNVLIAAAPYHDAFAPNGGGGAIFKLQFDPWMHSAFARFSDNSFHFKVSDATVGETYLLETIPDLAATDWTIVKEVQAQSSEVQLEVDLSKTEASFFRLRQQSLQ
jgi:hypothetical protein